MSRGMIRRDLRFAITWVGSRFEDLWLPSVLQIVLDMSHFMMSSNKILHSDHRALFYPVNEAGAERPV